MAAHMARFHPPRRRNKRLGSVVGHYDNEQRFRGAPNVLAKHYAEWMSQGIGFRSGFPTKRGVRGSLPHVHPTCYCAHTVTTVLVRRYRPQIRRGCQARLGV